MCLVCSERSEVLHLQFVHDADVQRPVRQPLGGAQAVQTESGHLHKDHSGGYANVMLYLQYTVLVPYGVLLEYELLSLDFSLVLVAFIGVDCCVCHVVVLLVLAAYWEGSWEVRYIRLCNQFGHIGAEDGKWCQQRVGTYRVKMRYCHCDNKDGCNAALPAAPSSSLIAPLGALTAALTLTLVYR